MARRQSLGSQLEAAYIRIQEQNAEILLLKEQLARASKQAHFHAGPSLKARMEERRTKAVEYCKVHGVKSVDAATLAAWQQPY